MEKGITRRPFDENGIVSADLYRKLMLGKLVINEGMLTENIVAQMLVAAGHKLYFSLPTRKMTPNQE